MSRTVEFEGRRVTRRELRRGLELRFEPLRPASAPRLIAAAIFGPLVWVACVLFAVLLIKPTNEIVIGVTASVLSLVAAVLILLLIRRSRLREEREHVDSA